ncbi:MAG: glycosyltransferase [Microcoleaceae cyanobacterium]
MISSHHLLLPTPKGSFVISNCCASLPANSHLLKLSLVIPTYQEGENITDLVQQLTQLLDAELPTQYELIVVDDDSPDQTWKIAQSLICQYPQLRVMRRSEERGLSTAVIRGWQVAQGEVLGVIDADLQHPPEILIRLLQLMNSRTDLVVASRHVESGGVSDWSFKRRFLSRGAQLLGLLILPGIVGQVSDPMSGYFLVRREAVANKRLNPVGYKILIEVIARGDIRQIAEAGYVFQERIEGESKVTWKHYLEYLSHLVRLRWSLWPVGRFLRFGVVGFSGVFVDLGMFYLLRTVWGLGLARSAIFSSELAILNNFVWNDLWTFGDVSRRQKGLKKGIKRFLKFNLVCLSGLILNVLLVSFLSSFLGMNEYLAKLIAIATVTLWNFWFNLKLSWQVIPVKK